MDQGTAMVSYTRFLKIDLPPKQSAFLWGARKTGKSTFLKQNFPESVYYDLLKYDLFINFVKSPNKFREEIIALPTKKLKHPIIVDEVQRVPELLNEIHWLIENSNAYFLLCGSSARKLKKSHVNLLGGRAWKYNFYPLVYKELSDFSLHKILNTGAIPSHYLSQSPSRSLKAYIEDYITQEIQFEGLVRNLPAFARFLDIMPFSNGEMTNYTNISRDCGIDVKTVKEYYQILVDTLLGYYVHPYKKGKRKDIIRSIPKFYIFDVGVANFLSKRRIDHLQGVEAGKALENYILQELTAFLSLREIEGNINYWRTKSGIEVDFILSTNKEQLTPIEVKISKSIHSQDLKGLKTFMSECNIDNGYLVCLEPRPRKVIFDDKNIHVINVEDFLHKLWNGEIVS